MVSLSCNMARYAFNVYTYDVCMMPSNSLLPFYAQPQIPRCLVDRGLWDIFKYIGSALTPVRHFKTLHVKVI